MASEVARMPSLFVSHSKNEQAISFSDDALGFQMPRGLDVPRQHSQHFSYSASKSSGFKPECSSGGFTPPGLWSDTSLSPVVESSTCSTETESNEDDDFMAGLAEQMTHFMLDNEEEDINTSSDKSNICSSNWLPFLTKPASRDTEEYNPCWLSGGWQGSYSHSADTVSLGPTSALSTPATVKDDPLGQFHSAKASKATNVKTDFLGERASIHWPKPQTNDEAVSKKIEEFLLKQALKQGPHNNTLVSKDSSLGRCESSVGSYMSGGSKPKSSGARSQRSWKLREEERKTYSNQCRHPRHGTPPSWARHSRPQQQSAAAPGHGRMNVHGSRTDQRCVRMLDPASAWQGSPNLNSGSNMRAVFLSGSGHGRESAGTGVFLPRCAGISHDTKRKPACSTVLLPSRIVQVLNLQMDDFHPQQYYPAPYMSSAAPGSSMGNSGSTAAGNMEYYPRQDYVKTYPSSHLHQPSQAEFNLPIDWTY